MEFETLTDGLHGNGVDGGAAVARELGHYGVGVFAEGGEVGGGGGSGVFMEREDSVWIALVSGVSSLSFV